MDEHDPEYISTSYGVALANTGRKKQKVEPPRVTSADLLKDKQKMDALKVKVLGDNSFQGELCLSSH
jgi:hypothetical protein